jgi:hypothetical protein
MNENSQKIKLFDQIIPLFQSRESARIDGSVRIMMLYAVATVFSWVVVYFFYKNILSSLALFFMISFVIGLGTSPFLKQVLNLARLMLFTTTFMLYMMWDMIPNIWLYLALSIVVTATAAKIAITLWCKEVAEFEPSPNNP